MRWIVICLLLVNALILGWRWYIQDETTPEPASADVANEAAPAIELLPDGSVAPTPKLPAESSSLSLPVSDTEAVPTETAPSGDAEPVGDVAAQAPNQAGNVSQPVVAAANAAFCAWTEWQNPPHALDADVEALHEERREQEIGRSYLVYIPAKVSKEETLARLAEIKALGIDAAFLNKGPQAGGISLGLFSKPESMPSRLAELKQAGLMDVVGIERIRTEPQTRQLLRWTGEKTPTSVQNQALVSCNDVAPSASGQ